MEKTTLFKVVALALLFLMPFISAESCQSNINRIEFITPDLWSVNNEIVSIMNLYNSVENLVDAKSVWFFARDDENKKANISFYYNHSKKGTYLIYAYLENISFGNYSLYLNLRDNCNNAITEIKTISIGEINITSFIDQEKGETRYPDLLAWYKESSIEVKLVFIGAIIIIFLLIIILIASLSHNGKKYSIVRYK